MASYLIVPNCLRVVNWNSFSVFNNYNWCDNCMLESYKSFPTWVIWLSIWIWIEVCLSFRNILIISSWQQIQFAQIPMQLEKISVLITKYRKGLFNLFHNLDSKTLQKAKRLHKFQLFNQQQFNSVKIKKE